MHICTYVLYLIRKIIETIENVNKKNSFHERFKLLIFFKKSSIKTRNNKIIKRSLWANTIIIIICFDKIRPILNLTFFCRRAKIAVNAFHEQKNLTLIVILSISYIYICINICIHIWTYMRIYIIYAYA